MRAKRDAHVTTETLDAAEGLRFFEKRCRALLGMGAGEFLAAYDSGSIWEHGDSEQVTELSIWVPFPR